MARKNRRQRPAPRALPRDGAQLFGARTVEGPRWARGEEFVMRRIGSQAATKFYICPGCNQNIPPGVAHIVAWPKDYGGRADDRRHWHNGCWNRR